MKVYISYARNDIQAKDELVKNLTRMEVKGIIQLWDKSRIKPGDELKPAIQYQLHHCEAALLLVSANFLADDRCQYEDLPVLISRAEKGELALIPIIYTHCFWEEEDFARWVTDPDGDPLNSYKAESERQRIWKNISKEIRELAAPPPSKIIDAHVEEEECINGESESEIDRVPEEPDTFFQFRHPDTHLLGSWDFETGIFQWEGGKEISIDPENEEGKYFYRILSYKSLNTVGIPNKILLDPLNNVTHSKNRLFDKLEIVGKPNRDKFIKATPKVGTRWLVPLIKTPNKLKE